MRNPARKAAIFGGITLLGLVMVMFAIRFPDAFGNDWMPAVLGALGGLAAFGCTIWLIMSLLHVRGMARLVAGIGRVTSWHVGAVDWEKFRLSDADRVKSDPQFRANDLWIRKTTPPEGVDIIVGEKSMIVDGSYHVLRMHGIPEMRNIGWLDNSRTPGRPPDCLEILLAYPRGKAGTAYTSLRVPVPQSAIVQGRQAYDHFAPALHARAAKGPIALRNPKRTLQVCGVILALGILASAAGWIMGELSGWDTTYDLTPMFLLMGGGAGMFFALLLGGLTLLMRPKAQPQR